MRLTDEWLQTQHSQCTPRQREVTDGQGLSVRITPVGLIVFQKRYRCAGVPRRLTLGRYPEMSLDAARAENAKLDAQLRRGRDPALERRLQHRLVLRAQSIEGLGRLWFENLHPRHFRPTNVVVTEFESFVFSRIGEWPPASVTLEHWIAVLKEAALADVDVATRLGGAVRRMLTWACRRRLISVNVMATREADIAFEQAVDAVGELQTQERGHALLEAVERSDMTRAGKDLLKICVSEC